MGLFRPQVDLTVWERERAGVGGSRVDLAFHVLRSVGGLQPSMPFLEGDAAFQWTLL